MTFKMWMKNTYNTSDFFNRRPALCCLGGFSLSMNEYYKKIKTTNLYKKFKY